MRKTRKYSRPFMFAGVVTQVINKGIIDYTTGLLTQEECKRRVEAMIDSGLSKGGLLLPGKAQIFRFDGDQFAIFYPGASQDDLWELYQSIQLP